MAKSTVAVRFTGDTTDLKRSLGQAEGGFSKLSGKAKVAMAAGATALVAFGKGSVDAFVESEEAQKKLADAFERFPNLAGTSQEALQKYNSELQKKTRFDDDAIASGQAVVAQFGITGDQLESLTPLLLDYAARTGKDLPAAAQDVGKAMLGNAKALKNIGIKYTATGDKAKDFANIQELLRQQVGGFAEKEGTTAAGKAAILSNQFGELQEKVGAKLVPVLTKLADIGLKIVDFLSNLSPEMQAAIGVVAGLAAGVFVIVKAVQAWTAVQAALNAVMALNPIALVVIAIAALIAGLVLAYQKVDWFRAFVDTAFNAVKTVISAVFNWITNNWKLLLAILTGPIGIAVGIIVTHWDTIKKAVMKVFNWVRDNWKLLLGIITGPIGAAVYIIATHWKSIKDGATAVWTWIRDAFNKVIDFFRGVPSKISSAASGMFNGIKNAFKSAINWIIDAWNRLEFGIPGFDPPGPGPSFGGVTIGTPNIPRLAKGGLVTRSGLAVVDRGERFSGVNNQFPVGGGVNLNVTINVPPTMDAGAAGQAITEALAAYVRRNGANDLRQIIGV